MTEHAKLSASGSHKWFNCPGSIKAEEGFPNETNIYAEEGILAHELAEALLTNKLIPKKKFNDDIKRAVNQYIQYLDNLSVNCKVKALEKRLEFSGIVPEGFGTVDAMILTEDRELHIVDFKYGMGRVEAKHNTQLLLYALGARKYFGDKGYTLSTIKLHIVQPRVNHFDVWVIDNSELDTWAENLKRQAKIALSPDAPRIPSEGACRYCRANSRCPALNNVVTKVINMTNKEELTAEEIRYVLDNSRLIINFINKLETKTYDELIQGREFPGYKLVSGRQIRKIKPEKEAFLVEILGEKAYNKSIIGIGQLENLVDKKTLESLIYLSTSPPILTKESDKREKLNMEELKFDPVE